MNDTDTRPSHPEAESPASSRAADSALDAYAPAAIAQRVESLGVRKARTDAFSLFVLAVLAGAFISLGAMLYAVIMTESNLGFGVTRLIGGIGFSLGLVLVVIAGAELFTGNNLLAMAWASRLITTREVMRNWLIVYAGNVVGCLGTVLIVLWADVANLGDAAVGDVIIRIGSGKASLSGSEAFARGILCNALVCLAIWLAMGGRSVTDRILAVVFPITAFVACGFEHSIANWFFLPFGLALDSHDAVPIRGVATNLLAVTAGNLVGGTMLVSAVYWLAYVRKR